MPRRPAPYQMIHSLSRYLEFLEADKLRGTVSHPVLMWSDPSDDFSENTRELTRPHDLEDPEGPTQVGDGLVFELSGAQVGGPGWFSGAAADVESSCCTTRCRDVTPSFSSLPQAGP